MSKLGPDAFACYVTTRSYEAVAKKFGVSKRTVVRSAKRGDWQRRLEAVEKEARERVEKKLVETIEAMDTRHLKSLRVIQGKSLEALRAMPIDSAMDAVRALDLAIRQERVIRGEPGERTDIRTGVLVVPAGISPEDWIAEQEALNATRVSPVPGDERR